ncbi:MAG: LysR family transcriptional regulator [Clostridiales bacterium]|nr:LysR family transcriptional regulator [Clostridiales bacterium]
MIHRKIEYFITLAECLSFTQTAAHYSVSQTAISQYISSLEERVGARLFDRTQRSVSLTEAGRYYYSRVKAALSEYDETLSQVRAIAQGYRGSLKVGVGLYEYCSTEELFSRFLAAHPEIRVDILQYPYSALTAMLRTGQLDVIIGDKLCESAFAPGEILSRTLFTSPNYIVAAPDVAGKYAGDVLEMLKSECLVTNCEADGPSSLAMLSDLFLEEFGYFPGTVSMTNSINAQLMMVRARHGVAMVPGFIVAAQGAGLTTFPLPSGRAISYQLMCMKDGKNPSARVLFAFG